MCTRIDTVGMNNSPVICRFVEFACKELNVTPKTVTVESMHHDVYYSTGAWGSCIDLEADEFVIMVYESGRTITEICNTIAHEMIHVKQYLNENLSDWISVCRDIAYENRWWEIEAFNNSFSLVEKFTKGLKF